RLAPSRDEDVLTCWLQDAGMHMGAVTAAKKRGIPGFFLREVDDILLGCGPEKCRKILLDRYIDVPRRYGFVPGEAQLENRKATLMKRRAGGWEIKNVAGLLEWTSVHLCRVLSARFKQRIMISQCSTLWTKISSTESWCLISHEVTLDDGKKRIAAAYNGQNEDGILGVTDGTYRLHFGGWTLVDFGTYTTQYEKKRYSKTFVPWAYMFVRTEHHVTYATMFKVVRSFASRIFEINLVLSFGSLDRSQFIASAYREVWPSIRLLNCYPHLARK
ncbi:hypothetical protein PHYSODRAFT_409375, partial [Phytophthora sojae]